MPTAAQGGERKNGLAWNLQASSVLSQKPVSSPNYLLPSSIYWLCLGCLEAIKELIVEISEDRVL